MCWICQATFTAQTYADSGLVSVKYWTPDRRLVEAHALSLDDGGRVSIKKCIG